VKRYKIQDTRYKQYSIIKNQFSKSLIIGCWILGIAWSLYLVSWLFTAPAYAQDKDEDKAVLTKGDAIMLISATDFMRKKVGELVSWTIGYDISKISRVKLTPTINYIKALPRRVPPDGRTIIEILASVDDPGGLHNISGVRADLSSIGHLSNAMLVDNGLYGDQKAFDGIYTLQTNASPQVDFGKKEVPIAVANKKGWLALAKTTLDIDRNPAIMEAELSPSVVPPATKTKVVLLVSVENSGRPEDLRAVTCDLSSLGLGKALPLKSAGDNRFTLSFFVPASVVAGDYPIMIHAENKVGGIVLEEVALKVSP